MRRARLTSAVATLGVAALVAAPAAASPAGFVGSRSSASAAATTPVVSSSSADSTSGSWWKFWDRGDAVAQPAFPPQANVATEYPSQQISPWKHPIKYFSASMMESPIGQSLSKEKSPFPPKASDAIALDKPIGPPTPEAMIALAQLAERQGNIEAARSQFRHALSKWPNDVEVLRATARLEDRQGQLQVAEDLYQRAVATNPQHAGAYNDLGLCLARQGKLDQSAQAIEQAICLQPDKALYRNNAATVLVELRQDQKALAHLSAVHNTAAANYNLGQLLVARGRTPDAVPYFQAAVEMDPTMEPARAALAQATGMPIAPAQVASEPLPTTPAGVAPTYGPQLVPQQSAQQQGYPATASGPAWNASSYVPQIAPAPPGLATRPSPTTQVTPVYQTATAPRYLPPIHGSVSGGSFVR